MVKTYEFLVTAHPEADPPCFTADVQMLTDIFARSLRDVPGKVVTAVLEDLGLSQTDASQFHTELPIATAYVTEDGYSVTRIESPTERGYSRRVYEELQEGVDAAEAVERALPDWELTEDSFHYQDERLSDGGLVEAPLPVVVSPHRTVSTRRAVPCSLHVDVDDHCIRLQPVEEAAAVRQVTLTPEQFVQWLDADYCTISNSRD